MTTPTRHLDTPDELARWLRIDVRTLRSWAKRGIVADHGGLLDPLEVADYVDARDATARPVKRSLPTAQDHVTMGPRDASPEDDNQVRRARG